MAWQTSAAADAPCIVLELGNCDLHSPVNYMDPNDYTVHTIPYYRVYMIKEQRTCWLCASILSPINPQVSESEV